MIRIRCGHWVTGLAVFLALFSAQLLATRPTSSDAGGPFVHVYSGARVRVERRVSSGAPSQGLARLAWQQFEARHPDAAWKVLWDLDTGVPLRVFGTGLPAPASVASPGAAAAISRNLLEQEIELLAPGAKASDFNLVSNTEHNGVRSVGFRQSFGGLDVLGGQLSFRFKNDRLVAMASEAFPSVVARASSESAPLLLIETSAVEWIRRDVDSRARQVGGASTLKILPLVRIGGGVEELEYAVVRCVSVESDQPPGRWDVYVDATTGEPVARYQRLMFGTGTALYNTPVRWPGGARADYPAPFARLIANGEVTNSNELGQFAWTGTNATVNTTVLGTYVAVANTAGTAATAAFPIADGGSFSWSASAVEFGDAQVTAFVHANRAKDYVRPWNPGLPWFDEVMPVNVNINSNCNAFADFTSINFFRQGGGCSNTGRLPDTIYHEFGHVLHQQSLIAGVGAFDPAMSEGVGDFLSATINNDSAISPGYYLNGAVLREIDPVGSEAIYPADLNPDPHISGLIYSGAFWDLRKALVMTLGQATGVQVTETLFYATLQRAVDMPSAYVEALIEDDDDGNLANGTPHFCAIDQAFLSHGLTNSAPNPLFGEPVISGLTVSVPTLPVPGCAIAATNMTLEWRNRSNTSQSGSVAMTLVDSRFRATIPFDTPGEVVQYRVSAEFSDGSAQVRPSNPADPWYESFIGIANVISCTNFESDPAAVGWTHAQTAGTVRTGADDWEWGPPISSATNGDPTAAFSGSGVFGNDLGGAGADGLYESSMTNEASSPVIDVSGYDHVHLQYRRWLNVEDGSNDHASIYANDVLMWSNYASEPGGSGAVQHLDREWRFHDVDVSAVASSNAVQLRFEMASDAGLEFGGWTLDDVCLVGFNGVPPADILFASGFETATSSHPN